MCDRLGLNEAIVDHRSFHPTISSTKRDSFSWIELSSIQAR